MPANPVVTTWFEQLPLPLVFILTVAFVLLAIYGGMRLATIGHKRSAAKDGESIGSVVGATLGLLAFILAFTFGMTSSRFDTRKQLLIDEVNAIGTAYLRTGLLPAQAATEARALLRDYVDLRVQTAREPKTLPQVITKSEAIQDRLWAQVEKANTRKPATVAEGLYINALNQMIDLQTRRVVIGLQHRVPSTIWLGLYAIAGLAMMTVGYQFGKTRRQVVVSVILSMAFSMVITLIADMDRAGEGTVNVSQQPFVELQQKFQASP